MSQEADVPCILERCVFYSRTLVGGTRQYKSPQALFLEHGWQLGCSLLRLLWRKLCEQKENVLANLTFEVVGYS